ncbi:protein TolR [Oharaeibacter diazotrophicus]|uniref:Cell division and transport-associated protein TolR n=1 Tax=Oharaeibacter diazotrophicus TaxID=1920512 RepID=A0A4R6RFK5_9HYPH|nr:protein TolR [Oharaeibacter diazotrophicus]TDP85093.1 cell division and transport-associated protein TolR [Oharaeibacter diazotrophicus]BBE74064.1 biopolymer transport protein ExbD [Pleomorphomonas sp. SM30]GLS76248.1 protein TolR [Oharaeibacter diazotrophicus]
MGMGVAGAGGGGRRRGRRRGGRAVMSEINVTPFVDVMLVLLIIFMVAAPLLTVGVPIDLPETAAKPLEGQTEPINVSVDPEGKVFIQDNEIALEELVPKLQAIAKNGVEDRIYVRGDKNADYGTVMRVMARISAAGFKKIGLITVEEQGTAPPPAP